MLLLAMFSYVVSFACPVPLHYPPGIFAILPGRTIAVHLLCGTVERYSVLSQHMAEQFDATAQLLSRTVTVHLLGGIVTVHLLGRIV